MFAHTAHSAARGYGHAHRQLRARLALVVERGEAVCCRCGRPIAPGSRWHVDHSDGDRREYMSGPSGPTAHAKCNIRAAALKGNRSAARSPKRTKAQAWWWA